MFTLEGESETFRFPSEKEHRQEEKCTMYWYLPSRFFKTAINEVSRCGFEGDTIRLLCLTLLCSSAYISGQWREYIRIWQIAYKCHWTNTYYSLLSLLKTPNRGKVSKLEGESGILRFPKETEHRPEEKCTMYWSCMANICSNYGCRTSMTFEMLVYMHIYIYGRTPRIYRYMYPRVCVCIHIQWFVVCPKQKTWTCYSVMVLTRQVYLGHVMALI